MHTHLVNVLMDLVLYVSLYIPNGPCTDMGEIWRGWVDFFTPDFTPIGSTCRPYEAQHSESPPGERKYGSCAERVLLVRMIVSWKHKRILNLMWYFGMNVLQQHARSHTFAARAEEDVRIIMAHLQDRNLRFRIVNSLVG